MSVLRRFRLGAPAVAVGMAMLFAPAVPAATTSRGDAFTCGTLRPFLQQEQARRESAERDFNYLVASRPQSQNPEQASHAERLVQLYVASDRAYRSMYALMAALRCDPATGRQATRAVPALGGSTGCAAQTGTDRAERHVRRDRGDAPSAAPDPRHRDPGGRAAAAVRTRGAPGGHGREALRRRRRSSLGGRRAPGVDRSTRRRHRGAEGGASGPRGPDPRAVETAGRVRLQRRGRHPGGAHHAVALDGTLHRRCVLEVDHAGEAACTSAKRDTKRFPGATAASVTFGTPQTAPRHQADRPRAIAA